MEIKVAENTFHFDDRSSARSFGCKLVIKEPNFNESTSKKFMDFHYKLVTVPSWVRYQRTNLDPYIIVFKDANGRKKLEIDNS